MNNLLQISMCLRRKLLSLIILCGIGFFSYLPLYAQSTDSGGSTKKMITYYNPSELLPSPYYSHAAQINDGRIIYISGQAALDVKGQIVGRGDFRKQAEKVFANLHSALNSAGASASDVVQIETYYVNRADLPVYGELRQAFFAARKMPPPASTTVQVAGLVTDGGLLEIGLIAVVEQRSETATSQITVVATLQAKAEQAAELEKLLLANAEKTRLEQGCLKYDLHRGLENRNLFVLYETWSNREALTKHFEMPYMKELAARRSELIERYEMNVLQRFD